MINGTATSRNDHLRGAWAGFVAGGRRPRVAAALRRGLAALAAALSLSGCALLPPPDLPPEARTQSFDSLAQEALPLAAPVEIHWTAEQVPFVIAESDGDLYYALGLVHAHLRGPQLQILKRAVEGRLAEMAGPPVIDLDHSLRILQFGRAAPQVVANWPDDTRLAMTRFVAGLNDYQRLRPERSQDMRVLGLAYEPWTPEDLVAIGRLAGADVTWFGYFELLPFRDRPEFADLFRAALDRGESRPPGGRATPPEVADALTRLLRGVARTGSNSLVVGADLMATGAPAIASDPHLGYTQPSTWLIAGVKSPTTHTVGFMVPGLPFVALGRNAQMAWGGTNLRAAASDLYDLSHLPEAALPTEELEIGVRFWFDTTRTRRQSPLGPVISDAPALGAASGPPFALRWVGHEPTDEITAFLRGNRAATPEAFRAAFQAFGVSGQNLLFAHVDGTIGRIFATTQPRRGYDLPPDLILDGDDPALRWQGFDDATTLPMELNPARGYIASANDAPPFARPVIGWFYGPPDRAERLGELVETGAPLSIDALKAIQLDVVSAPARALAHDLAAQARAAGAEPASFVTTLAAWDGAYGTDSAGAAAFELLLGVLVPEVWPDGPEVEWPRLSRAFGPAVAALPAARRAPLLREAVRVAARRLADHPSWGELHRLRVGHALGAIPVLGSGFTTDRPATGGSRDTVLKSSHDLITGPHEADFGSQSRHVSDLSDPDANWFVLFGGQDGWPGSASFSDQVPLFLEGRYVRVPLREETVRATFDRLTVLSPVPR